MFTLNCRGRMVAATHALVMGIINVTPDSFFARSRRTAADAVLRLAEDMISDGADIIDLGAQSTRPGSEWLTEEEELTRLDGIMESLSSAFPQTVFSVDSFYSRVAGNCLDAGASMINDISGGMTDKEMLPLVAAAGVPYVCMHMRGTPQTMLEHAEYDNVTRTVLDFFIERNETCRIAGIRDLILDPGFGFSKNIPQNFELLKNLSLLKMVDKPILVGLSRKSTISRTLGIDSADALNGTTVLNTIALMNGASILRVHDVKEAKECVKLFAEIAP